MDLSSRTLRHLSGLLAGHRRRIGPRWRRLTCGRQALLVLSRGALLHSVARNHALIDGNKRTARLAMRVFLRFHGVSAGIAPSPVSIAWKTCRAVTSSRSMPPSRSPARSADPTLGSPWFRCSHPLSGDRAAA
ncbi:Fic family protein [Streptomyces griseolus]|nr:Fic family protein [Streptomyces griseolus]